MEDKRVLSAEDLGSVAGGIQLSQLTQEERHVCKALRKKYEKAVLDRGNGLCDKAAVDAALREYMEFMAKMNEKYS